MSNLQRKSFTAYELYPTFEYKAEFKKPNNINYPNYIARVMEKYYLEKDNFHSHLIVIYTDNAKGAGPIFETNCTSLRQAFLSHIIQTWKRHLIQIRLKIHFNTSLKNDNLIKLITLLLIIPIFKWKLQIPKKTVKLWK